MAPYALITPAPYIAAVTPNPFHLFKRLDAIDCPGGPCPGFGGARRKKRDGTYTELIYDPQLLVAARGLADEFDEFTCRYTNWDCDYDSFNGHLVLATRLPFSGSCVNRNCISACESLSLCANQHVDTPTPSSPDPTAEASSTEASSMESSTQSSTASPTQSSTASSTESSTQSSTQSSTESSTASSMQSSSSESSTESSMQSSTQSSTSSASSTSSSSSSSSSSSTSSTVSGSASTSDSLTASATPSLTGERQKCNELHNSIDKWAGDLDQFTRKSDFFCGGLKSATGIAQVWANFLQALDKGGIPSESDQITQFAVFKGQVFVTFTGLGAYLAKKYPLYRAVCGGFAVGGAVANIVGGVNAYASDCSDKPLRRHEVSTRSVIHARSNNLCTDYAALMAPLCANPATAVVCPSAATYVSFGLSQNIAEALVVECVNYNVRVENAEEVCETYVAAKLIEDKCVALTQLVGINYNAEGTSSSTSSNAPVRTGNSARSYKKQVSKAASFWNPDVPAFPYTKKNPYENTRH